MNSTLLLDDPLFLQHHPGEGHPERPERLEAIHALLGQVPLPHLRRERPRDATREELLSVHPEAFVNTVLQMRGKQAQFDEDGFTSERSVDAAVRAAGAAVQAVEEVLAHKARNAFALVRPPGHHAEPSWAMGFCLFGNVAIAAEAARRSGVERVAVLDWDVHHGNGTQASFYGRQDVLFLSSHQFPLYPGTGAPFEIGDSEGKGFTVNCALPPGQTDHDYGAVFQELFLPVLEQFRPQLLLVSAGFDAHAHDPLANMKLSERGFAAMATAARRLAEATCEGKLVLLLEGGYDLRALATSVHACLEVLGGRNEEFPSGTKFSAGDAIETSWERLRDHWKQPGRSR